MGWHSMTPCFHSQPPICFLCKRELSCCIVMKSKAGPEVPFFSGNSCRSWQCPLVRRKGAFTEMCRPLKRKLSMQDPALQKPSAIWAALHPSTAEHMHSAHALRHGCFGCPNTLKTSCEAHFKGGQFQWNSNGTQDLLPTSWERVGQWQVQHTECLQASLWQHVQVELGRIHPKPRDTLPVCVDHTDPMSPQQEGRNKCHSPCTKAKIHDMHCAGTGAVQILGLVLF